MSETALSGSNGKAPEIQLLVAQSLTAQAVTMTPRRRSVIFCATIQIAKLLRAQMA